MEKGKEKGKEKKGKEKRKKGEGKGKVEGRLLKKCRTHGRTHARTHGHKGDFILCPMLCIALDRQKCLGFRFSKCFGSLFYEHRTQNYDPKKTINTFL